MSDEISDDDLAEIEEAMRPYLELLRADGNYDEVRARSVARIMANMSVIIERKSHWYWRLYYWVMDVAVWKVLGFIVRIRFLLGWLPEE